jgi:hypothetical protein
MTFEEHDELPSSEEDKRKYIDCNVKYSDKDYPKCNYPAYQIFGSISFLGFETSPSGY